jgi:hypothetical protein
MTVVPPSLAHPRTHPPTRARTNTKPLLAQRPLTALCGLLVKRSLEASCCCRCVCCCQRPSNPMAAGCSPPASWSTDRQQSHLAVKDVKEWVETRRDKPSPCKALDVKTLVQGTVRRHRVQALVCTLRHTLLLADCTGVECVNCFVAIEVSTPVV